MKNQTIEVIKEIGHVIDIWMPMKIKYDDTPAVSIAISHKGKVIYSKGFGLANIEQGKKADGETLYHIASHSKMFTAVAIMRLVEEGKLRLDDHVADYILWFKGKSKHADASNITVRQVLSHTAGIVRDGYTPQWETGDFPKDLQKSFSPKSLVIENLTTFKYTNYGYSLLGLVIEKTSGMTYEEYATEKIIKPLGLKNTYPDYKKDIRNIATGYSAVVPDEKRFAFDHYPAHAYTAATGFVSNASDLVKFISSFSINEGSKNILGRESIKEMTRSHAKTEEGDEYGLGLDIFSLNGKKVIGHGGGFNGYITRTLFDTQNDIAVIVLTNSLSSSAGRLAHGILDSIHKLISNPQDYKSNSKISYSKYEGIYRGVWGDSLITKVGNILISNDPETNNPLKGPLRLLPTSGVNTFVMKSKAVFGSYDEEAVFSDFKNGKAQRVTKGSMPMRRIY